MCVEGTTCPLQCTFECESYSIGNKNRRRAFYGSDDSYLLNLEHSRAIHCNATASGPLRGDGTDRWDEGGNEVLGSEGDILGESKGKGSGDGIRIRIRIVDRHVKGVGTELRQWGERLEWGGM